MTKPKKTTKTASATTDRRDAVLQAALPDVAFDGWTPALLARAADKTGTDAATLDLLFPRGVKSLLAHFANWIDRQTEERLLQQDMAQLRIRDRIALGVSTRLAVMEPYKQAVSAALGHGIDPRHAVAMPRHLWHSADTLWWLAGDTATDWNHYSKRALLSGVIASTTLYWLADTSEDHTDTQEFLDRRIDNVLRLGRGLGALREKLSAFTSPFSPRRRNTAA